MHYRSWLVVPGDSEKKLGSAVSIGADVIVIDLGEQVAPERRKLAREQAADWLTIHRRQVTGGPRLGRWARISALDSRMWRDDLLAVMRGGPDGIILPRAAGPQAVQHLAAEIYELEPAAQVVAGSTRIIPEVSGTAHAAATIGSYIEASLPRLGGLGWNAPELAAALGATRTHHAGGGWSDPFSFVRGQVLIAAHARGILSVETAHADFADEKGVKAAARHACADGFSGMLAIHPSQVPMINAAFAPGEAQLEEARAIVSAFAGDPGAATVQMDRRTVDQPQLRLARRLLGLEDGQQAEAAPRAPILRLT